MFPGGESLGSDPFKALDKTPGLGLLQIVITCGIIEVLTETVLTGGKHYINHGDGHMNPMMFGDVPAEMKEKELKNGRLAMIGIFSFMLGDAVPGSVPAIPAAWGVFGH